MPKLVQWISHFIRFSSQFGSAFGPASVREGKRLWKMNKKVFLLARNFCCHAKRWLSPGVNYFMLNLHLPPEWRCKAAISEVLRFKATIPEAYTRLMAEIFFWLSISPQINAQMEFDRNLSALNFISRQSVSQSIDYSWKIHVRMWLKGKSIMALIAGKSRPCSLKHALALCSLIISICIALFVFAFPTEFNKSHIR